MRVEQARGNAVVVLQEKSGNRKDQGERVPGERKKFGAAAERGTDGTLNLRKSDGP